MTKFQIALTELREKLEEVKQLANEEGQEFSLGGGYATTIRYVSPNAYISEYLGEPVPGDLEFDQEAYDSNVDYYKENTNNGWYSSSMSC